MKKFIFAMLALLFVLGGCAEKGKSGQTNSNQSETNEKIEITHALGTETFDKVPERIVVLEWNFAEELLALGVQPVGMADIEGFNKWVKISESIADDVVDVGTRQEPNLEEIAKLNPDVIITLSSNHGAIQDQLTKIAPTIFYDTVSPEVTKDLYQNTFDSFKTTAKLLGKEAEAEQLIQRLDEKYAEAAKKIDELNLPTREFLFTQAYTVNQAPTFRLFTKNSMVSHVLEKVGLENVIKDNTDAPWGFIDANVEGVSNYEDALFIHAVQQDDPLFDNLQNNKAWNELAFVKNEQLYDIGGDTWTFGGVLSMETLVDNLLRALQK
ncbi:iron-siderophore ABC transporter substrate-binding protein [Sporosarcina sp. ACRSM]|uniref:ABC transporter substrate-binding protein n=1 Tax=Sporosarcina sp. ACRSM TaxID=2918216 RepID=UPI001EF66871|nr:iron-siderophore ABC transporter substrate-binding protein [Sporosarcina sp. ACRSM]MCG7337628.1 iron-siderophore ABC transporter substrate-binding protein [Sporosarcina sp. ACRSM]